MLLIRAVLILTCMAGGAAVDGAAAPQGAVAPALFIASDVGRHLAGAQVLDEAPHIIGLVGPQRDAALALQPVDQGQGSLALGRSRFLVNTVTSQIAASIDRPANQRNSRL